MHEKDIEDPPAAWRLLHTHTHTPQARRSKTPTSLLKVFTASIAALRCAALGPARKRRKRRRPREERARVQKRRRRRKKGVQRGGRGQSSGCGFRGVAGPAWPRPDLGDGSGGEGPGLSSLPSPPPGLGSSSRASPRLASSATLWPTRRLPGSPLYSSLLPRREDGRTRRLLALAAAAAAAAAAASNMAAALQPRSSQSPQRRPPASAPPSDGTARGGFGGAETHACARAHAYQRAHAA